MGAPTLSVNNQGAAGAVYIFERRNGSWVEIKKLTASTPMSQERMGWTISLKLNRLIVGAPLNGTNGSDSGNAYIFERTGADNTTWAQTTQLFASDASQSARFGEDVFIDGNLAVVSAHWDTNRTGAVYAYDYQNGAWSQTQKITASDAKAGDRFGNTVTISAFGNTKAITVGSPNDDDRATNSGSIYNFFKVNNQWAQRTKVLAMDAQQSNSFGQNMATDQSWLVVQALGDNAYASAVYVLRTANTPPSALSQTVTTPQNTPMNITLSATDTENDPVTYFITSQPANGTVRGTPPSITYTPNNNFAGTDRVGFKANDGSQDSDIEGFINITVEAVNQSPVFIAPTPDENAMVPAQVGQQVSIVLAASDAEIDPLTFSAPTLPAGATLNGNTITWTPNMASNAPVNVKVSDGNSDTTRNFTIIAQNTSMMDMGQDMNASPDMTQDMTADMAQDMSNTPAVKRPKDNNDDDGCSSTSTPARPQTVYLLLCCGLIMCFARQRA